MPKDLNLQKAPDKPEAKAPAEEAPPVEDAPVEETVAPEPEVQEEARVVIALVPEYDGPEPVVVSSEGHNQVEIDKTGTSVPATVADSFTSLPYVEVVD